ncbi:hypothetical protein N5D03_13490, partial [Empedobacter sp. GD03861]|uniref:hypothetical protein n=1 Tax=Empedobacter sp. GD03861 TaxID=2975390 RepID=UPI002447FA12
MEQKKLLEISDELLDLLLDFKKDHPDFTFSLRERDSPQAKDVKRLEKGQWFQGSNYIYVPLFRKGDNARKIKTIGFVVGSNKEGEQTNYIEISFKKGDFTNEEISFHKELSEIFDIKLNNENVGYFQFDDPKNYIENLGFYLNEFRSKALELLKSYKLEDRFLITEDNFQKRLEKINEIKKVLGDPSYSINNLNTIIKESEEKIMKQPLNQILYGPPGTGKTYSLKQKFFDLFTVRENSLSREQFLNELVKPLSWWQVITIVLLDINKARVTEIYDHELIKIKESQSASKTIVPTIWGQLQAHTVNDCPNVNVEKRQNPLYFSKDKNSIWTIDLKLVEELYPEIIEIFNSFKNFNPSPNKLIKNYEFVTFHQSFTYEDFIEGIKPDLENEDGEIK